MKPFKDFAAKANVEKLHDRLVSHYNPDKINTSVLRGIKSYTNKNFEALNRQLRNNKPLSKATANTDKSLKALARGHETPVSFHVYRGITYHPNPENKSEPIVQRLHGYTSTSLSPSIAKGYTDRHSEERHMLKIHVPKGSHGAYIDHLSTYGGEKEFLFHTGAKIEIHPKPKVEKTPIGKLYIWNAKMTHDGVKDVK